jgi:hypothetical protein
MIFIEKKIDTLKIETLFLNLIILLFIFRSSNPLFKYPFIPIYLGFIIYTLFFHPDGIKNALKTFFLNYYLVLISLVIFILAFLLSRKFYLSIFKDILNDIVLMSFFFLAAIYIKSKQEFLTYLNRFNTLVLFFAFLISVLGILDMLDILPYAKYFLFKEYINNSIPIDYNFALLPVFYGILIILSFSFTKCSLLKRIFFSVFFIVFVTHIFFSGSKRGIILLTVILLSIKYLI